MDHVRIMGILNVTPDSFSDGGKYDDVEAAVSRAREMIEEGADIIDIGGESTGPRSSNVSLEEELRRVIPVVRGVKRVIDSSVISIDTYKAEVARQAIAAGASMVNDVTALRGDPEMASVVASSGVSVVLMYSKDATPRTTSEKVQYDDVVRHISGFLKERVSYALSHGVKREQIILDPGMGAFVSGDSKYSVEILKRLREFQIGFPVLIGASRKGFIGEMMGGAAPDERLFGSLACAAVAVQNGAGIVRVHDVKETLDFLENIAYGISNDELLRRSKERTISYEDFLRRFE